MSLICCKLNARVTLLIGHTNYDNTRNVYTTNVHHAINTLFLLRHFSVGLPWTRYVFIWGNNTQNASEIHKTAISQPVLGPFGNIYNITCIYWQIEGQTFFAKLQTSVSYNLEISWILQILPYSYIKVLEKWCSIIWLMQIQFASMVQYAFWLYDTYSVTKMKSTSNAGDFVILYFLQHIFIIVTTW